VTSGAELPEIRTPLPGPRSRALGERLARAECPQSTAHDPAPLFWERAQGANVLDVDGNRFVDLVAAFGVCALGHADPELARIAARQAHELPHAMGDVYPAALKVELLERLAALLPGDLGLGLVCTSGSDAVEAALKTALVATGKPGVIAFEGAYHGLSLGALDVTHRGEFRAPFATRLPRRTVFLPFGDAAAVRSVLRSAPVGAILVEPVQGRGGIRPAPPGFLAELRTLCDSFGALLIADEIYTGLGRTGSWLACEHDGVRPDLVALGKALGGGFPISICLGRREVMQAWPPARGEALHTGTHFGNPLGCALALGVLDALERRALPARARALGAHALARLQSGLAGSPGVRDVRGRGLMLGIELDSSARAHAAVQSLLHAGWIVLSEGEQSNVLSLTPPLTISEPLLDAGLSALIARLAV
jgi:acetylornithine/succinyldiaminopimelate/putrescine aminotransferase